MERASVDKEAAVRRFLQGIDGLLDLKWYDAIRRYALVARWPAEYPLRALYQKGEIDDDCDILGWYAVDPHDADTAPKSLDQMEQQVMDILKRSDNEKTPWKLRLSQIASKNIERKRKLREPIIDQVGGIAKDLEYMIGHNEEVRMKRIMKNIVDEAIKEAYDL